MQKLYVMKIWLLVVYNKFQVLLEIVYVILIKVVKNNSSLLM